MEKYNPPHWSSATEPVTDHCWLLIHCAHTHGKLINVYVEVGDDGHMNGIDIPAQLRSPADAKLLIKALARLAANWPTS